MVDMESALIIETDLAFSKGIGYILEQEGFSILYAYNIQDARKNYKFTRISVNLYESENPWRRGNRTCKRIERKGNKNTDCNDVWLSC